MHILLVSQFLGSQHLSLDESEDHESQHRWRTLDQSQAASNNVSTIGPHVKPDKSTSTSMSAS
jgi:hypothetical protein